MKASTASSSRMSSASSDAVPPPPRSPATVSRSGSSRRPQMATAAPSRASSSARRLAQAGPGPRDRRRPGRRAGPPGRCATARPRAAAYPRQGRHSPPKRRSGHRQSRRYPGPPHEGPRRAEAPGRAALPRGSEGATVAVEPIEVGEVTQPGGYFQRPGGPFESAAGDGPLTPRSRWWTVPCTAFLIRHPTVGPFLVDTGLHGSVAAKPAENHGPDVRVVCEAAPGGRPGPALAASRARHRCARDPPGGDDPPAPRPRLGHGRLPGGHVRADARPSGTTRRRAAARSCGATCPASTTTPSTTGRSSFTEGITSYSTFGRTFDLFGDGSVRLAYTPGHSAGHQSVICRLRDRDLVIAGDVVYTLSQLDTAPGPREAVRPAHLQPLAPGAEAVSPPVPAGGDHPQPRPRALAAAREALRVAPRACSLEFGRALVMAGGAADPRAGSAPPPRAPARLPRPLPPRACWPASPGGPPRRGDARPRRAAPRPAYGGDPARRQARAPWRRGPRPAGGGRRPRSRRARGPRRGPRRADGLRRRAEREDDCRGDDCDDAAVDISTTFPAGPSPKRPRSSPEWGVGDSSAT